jgi:hypothetical protein
MILKEADDRSDDIKELKRLKDASPPRCQAAIQRQIEQIYAGISGERDAAHFLNREFGQSQSIAILHDLRLPVDGGYAQIDHLVMHRFQGAVWVLETKNYAGRLSCDEHGDWTVWRNKKPQPIPSPINQAQRHCKALRSWLDANGIKTIHTLHPVVLISPTSSVNRSQLPPETHVIKSDNFADWLNKQFDQIGIGKALGMLGRHLVKGMSADDFLALGDRLARAHVPPTYNWRAMLRLPNLEAPEPPLADDSTTTRPSSPAKPRTEDRQIIPTPLGEVTITRIPDGRFAVRNDKNDALIEVVRCACRGRGQWNPRFRNWLVAEEELPGIVAALHEAV